MMHEIKYDLLVITGPTASGKTRIAATLASILGGEIISADSRQVYRRMDIGTGKDLSDYVVSGNNIPCHLIDIAEPGTKYNLFEFRKDFLRVYSDMTGRKVFPVVCGGSGMYIDSIVSDYRIVEVAPDYALRAELETKSMEELMQILASFRRPHNVTDFDTRKRAIRAIEIEKHSRMSESRQSSLPELRPLLIGISYNRDSRRKRISERLLQRIEQGMITEVRNLLQEGLAPESLIYYGLEYKYITLYVTGKINYTEMFSGLETAIHQFAKRQMTWFRGMERRGVKIHWIEGDLPLDEKTEVIIELLKK